ncbi:MAG: hypothetical protein QOE59_4580 [Actinomycetota bacterium]|nr:hypothetical protein [Actinomycetota bacterium]
MTVYVSLAQFPLTLKYEEPLEDVARHHQGLVEEGKVHRVQVTDDSMVLLNFGVIESITLSEGARTLEVEELNQGLSTSTGQPPQ